MTQHRFASLPEASEKDIETAVSKYVNHDMKERKTVTDYSASELSMLAKAKKLVHTFTQTHTTYAPYANQSGEIFGILTQLLEEMTGDLKALEERDAKSAKESTELLAGISEALSMLTADDARDMFTSTYSFLQMRVQRRRLSAVNRAANILAHAAEKSNDASLLALSTSMRLDGFEKVKKAIDEMIADLKQEQADEVKHKDWCDGELHGNEMTTMKEQTAKQALETKIEDLSTTLKTITSEIEEAQKKIGELQS